MSDLIDEYLELVASNLRGPALESHHTLLETEDHLRSAVADFMRQGMSDHDAQIKAISQFGVASDVAAGHNAEVGIFSFGSSLCSLFAALWELVAIGFMVIGASAAVAYVASILTSKEAVFGMPPSALPAAAQCSYWLSIHPTAANCQQAGTWEAANDSTWLLGMVGIVGVFLYITLTRFRRSNRISFNAIPPMLIPVIAGTIFFLASVSLFVLGQSNGVVESVWGQGRWYAESATSFVASIISAVFLLRSIKETVGNDVL